MWNSFLVDDLMNEVKTGRPLMLGFASLYGNPHSTVCVGFELHGNEKYVVFSDAHVNHYVIKPFNSPQENDFMATVRVVAS